MFNYSILRPSIPSLLVSSFSSISAATLLLGTVDALGAFLAFFFLPIIGGMSDKRGRRPALLLTLLLTSLPVIALAAMPFLPPAPLFISHPFSSSSPPPSSSSSLASSPASPPSPSLSIYLFLFAQLFSKLSPFSSVYSYISDTSPEAQRPSLIANVSAVVFFALTSGPLLARYVTMETSFVIAGAVSVATWAYCLLIMPESVGKEGKGGGGGKAGEKERLLPGSPSPLYTFPSPSSSSPLLSPTSPSSLPSLSPGSVSPSLLGIREEEEEGPTGPHKEERRKKSRELYISEAAEEEKALVSSSIPVGTSSSDPSLSLFSTLSFMFRSPFFSTLFSLVFFEQLAIYGLNEIMLLFLMQQCHFDRNDNIMIGIVGGVGTCAAMLLLLPLASRVMGEKRVICCCLLLYLMYTALYLFVKEKWEVYALLSLSSLSSLAYPSTCTLLSYSVAPAEMGLSQAALQGIRSLSLGVGPLAFALIFAFFAQEGEGIWWRWPQAPFLLAAISTFVALIYAIRLPGRKNMEQGGYMRDIEIFNRKMREEAGRGEGEGERQSENGDKPWDLEAEINSPPIIPMKRRDSEAELQAFLLVKQLNARTLVK